MPRGTLWFFLRDQGEDMRKWDGEPTFKLEAHVHELRGKRPAKYGSPKKAVSLVAVETQEDNQRSPRHRRTEITSLDPGEWTSGLALQGSGSEYSDQEQEHRGSLPLTRRKGMTGFTGLCGLDGLAHQTHRSIRLW